MSSVLDDPPQVVTPVAGEGDGPEGPEWSRPVAPRAPTAHRSGPSLRQRRFRAVVFALFVAGLLAFTFLAYEFWASSISESRSQAKLLAELQQGLTQPDSNVYLVPIAGRPIGILQIPTIGIQQVIVQGVSTAQTKLGPGHDPSTPLPGQTGNVVILGRRTTYGGPFHHLNDLSVGDSIVITTRQGQFVYRVIGAAVVPLGSPVPIAPTTDDRLTLVTSNPPYLARSELIVAAKLTTPGLQDSGPLPSRPIGMKLALTADTASWGPILLWGELLVLAIAITWILYRRRWSSASTYLLTTPVLIALTFLLCSSIDRLLPPSL